MHICFVFDRSFTTSWLELDLDRLSEGFASLVNEAESSSLCLKVVVILCFERDIKFECGLARNFENDG